MIFHFGKVLPTFSSFPFPNFPHLRVWGRLGSYGVSSWEGLGNFGKVGKVSSFVEIQELHSRTRSIQPNTTEYQT